LTLANDHGLGTGSVTANNSTLTFQSFNPVLNNPVLNASTATFTNLGGQPTLNNPTMTNGSVVDFSASGSPSIVDMVSDAMGSGNNIVLGAGTTLQIQVDSPATQYYGTISTICPPGGSLNVSTGGPSGELDLYGANTYSNGTTVQANVVLIAGNNSALGSGPVTLNTDGNLAVAPGVTITNQLTLQDDSRLGSAAGYPVPGTLTFSNNVSLVFGKDGLLQFSIMNAGGVAGTDYSAINASNSSLNITATPGHQFTIQLISVDPGTGQAGLANFNNSTAYSWTLISASSITNYDPTYFFVDSGSLFQNALGGGIFS